MRPLPLLALATVISAPAYAAPSTDPAARAAATEAAMTPDERVILTKGVMAIPLAGPVDLPPDAVLGAGYIAGIPRLGVPSLTETDASLGVSYVMNLRNDGGATALPSAMSMGATWNPKLMRKGGVMIGGEAHAKGFNVLLAGGVNLMRDPRNGRTFEYLGEDPLHSGIMVGEAISGIQSNNVISTIKHFALNGQETGRHFVDSKISDAAARESDLLAFQIGIERGQPGSVMCAYNKVNGAKACGSDYLLNQVLKRDWGYKGFVMADWGATQELDYALKGLDQQSGSQLDPKVFFGDELKAAAAKDPAYAARLSDMNRRILHAIYAVGVDKNPPVKKSIDFVANAKVAQEVAEQGIVLLRNKGNALPLAVSAKKIAVIGGYADTGVLSGAGSAQVHADGGPAAFIPLGGDGVMASFIGEAYHRSNPLAAIKKRAPEAKVSFRTGQYIEDSVEAAKNADVAIVFATQWMTEGLDQPDLSLSRGQDALIAAVAEANPNTIVVLETGGPIAMPWLDKTAAVIEAWYPGIRGGEAIASVLFGDVNPSGRLPATFPASVDQLPRKKVDGSDTIEPNFLGRGEPGQVLEANYDIEGSDVGYRWFARKGLKSLFPFGFGLSYTSFSHSGLSVTAAGNTVTARFTVSNTGSRAGADVPQLYLVSAAGNKRVRLAGWERIELAPGASQTVSVKVDPRILADWSGKGWTIAGGDYEFALGTSAEAMGQPIKVKLKTQTFKP